jgi:hypothetical protein
MSVAAATMAMTAGATTRTDGRPFVAAAFWDLAVSRAAFFFAERARTRLFAFFTDADIFFSETLRRDRSTLSRYRTERADGCAFLTRTVLPLNGLPCMA